MYMGSSGFEGLEPHGLGDSAQTLGFAFGVGVYMVAQAGNTPADPGRSCFLAAFSRWDGAS